MNKAICTVSVAPLRAGPAHTAEMVSQMLFGESADILEAGHKFSKIRMHFDGYEGWISHQQISTVTDEVISTRKTTVLTSVFQVSDVSGGPVLLSMGSELDTDPEVAEHSQRQSPADTAMLFVNVPYLWSGRSFFGIDCSGLTQLVYKAHGTVLPRDAWQQAEKGVVLDFVEESEPGDLAFFEDEEGRIIHVGMMLDNQKIIHAYGKVRIDLLDSSGIFNMELNKHTHKLRFIKRIS